ncbi:MAG: hypothetical protein ACTSPB_15340 [Candidatus Thorarchaeota archaeon]
MRPNTKTLPNPKVQELQDAGAVLLDPEYLDSAIVDCRKGTAIYSYDGLVQAFCEHEDFSVEDAREWVEYNTIRALSYIDDAPIVIYD